MLLKCSALRFCSFTVWHNRQEAFKLWDGGGVRWTHFGWLKMRKYRLKMDKMTGTENKCHIDSEKGVHKSRKENCNQTFFTRTLHSTLTENTFIWIVRKHWQKHFSKQVFFCQQNTLHKSIYIPRIYFQQIFQEKIMRKKV